MTTTSSAVAAIPLLYEKNISGLSLIVSLMPRFTFVRAWRKQRTFASSKRVPHLS